MKRNKFLIQLISLTTLFLVSCSKEYNCDCELFDSQEGTTFESGTTTIKAQNPSDAQVKCNGEEDSFGYDHLHEYCEITGEK